MPLSLDEYRCKLINKILFASSQEEVERFCNAALKGMQSNNVNGYIIARFTDRIINELDGFTQLNQDAQQWNNIKMARIQFNRIKHQMESKTN